jgi:hypothetical protein
MNSRTKLFGLNTLLAISLLLTACGTPTPPPTPTMDVNALFTQAAQTVVAQMTANAPTVTPTKAATNTPLPTFTPLGGALPTLPPLSTLPALATATKQGFTGPDKAVYITQSPSDYSTVKTGQVFNITWRLQNTGTTTWNQNYAYRFYSATAKIPTSANGYNLTATVAPGAFADLTAVATAPSSPGTYDTLWVLTNANGENFSSFSLTINVVQGPTTSSSAEEPTGVPEKCPADVLHYATPRSVAPGTAVGTPWVLWDDADPTSGMQGGRMKIIYDIVEGSTGTFEVDVDGVTHGPFPLGANGYAIFGQADDLRHHVTITVTGSNTLNVTQFVSATEASCF